MSATSHIYAHVKNIEDFINEDDNTNNTNKAFGAKLATDEIYQTLMKKEEKVLDVINNMTDYKRTKESEAGRFLNMSLHGVVQKTFRVLTELMEALRHKQNTKDVIHEFVKEGRLIYVGLFVVFVSLFLLLLTL